MILIYPSAVDTYMLGYLSPEQLLHVSVLFLILPHGGQVPLRLALQLRVARAQTFQGGPHKFQLTKKENLCHAQSVSTLRGEHLAWRSHARDLSLWSDS